jgi:hypothetical protein
MNVPKLNVRKEDEPTSKKNKINSLYIQNENSDIAIDNENDDQLISVCLYVNVCIYTHTYTYVCVIFRIYVHTYIYI